MASEELLTVQEVADRFRVSPNTVARWLREGKLEGIRLPGRVRRFRQADIEKVLNTSAGTTPAEVA